MKTCAKCGFRSSRNAPLMLTIWTTRLAATRARGLMGWPIGFGDMIEIEEMERLVECFRERAEWRAAG